MLYFFCFPGHPETDDDEEIEVDVNDDEEEEETSEIDDRESSPGAVAAVWRVDGVCARRSHCLHYAPRVPW